MAAIGEKKLAPCVALKAWRARYGLTQKALAEELGISPKTYNFKENGLVSFLEHEINHLVERTGLTYEELLINGRKERGRP